MKKVKSFEDLWIWQQARILVRDIYSDFGEGTPGYRDYGFKDQIQRAGISVMNNIAEVSSVHQMLILPDFLILQKDPVEKFRSMYYTAEDLGYVIAEVASQRREKAKQIAGGIASLTSHLRS